MSSREQFEAAFPVPSNIRWSDEHQSYGFIRRKGSDLSQVHRYRSVWNAWQASRQALEIVLPPIGIPSSAEDTWHNVRNNTIEACGRAIEAAGVRVKA